MFSRLFGGTMMRFSKFTLKRNILFVILIIYFLFLSGYLLWPFNFDFTQKNHARWIEEGPGIEFPKRGLLINKEVMVDLFDKLTTGNGITIEIWIESNINYQHGPARIISYSIDPYSRNFTLGQSENNLILRLRTSESDLNGLDQQLEIENVFTEKKVHHIVATYNFERRCIYIDGNIAISSDQLKGDFSNWDSSHRLLIGNEASGNRPWLGKIFYAALYRRALNEEEILQKFRFGFKKITNSIKSAADFDSRPVLSYLFDEHAGNIIYDKSGNSTHVNLYMPEKIPRDKERIIFSSLKNNLEDLLSIDNILTNILIFLPLGFFLTAILKMNRLTDSRLILSVLTLSATVSIGIEFLHFYLPNRHSSMVEILLKMIGVSVGMVTYLYFGGLKKYISKE